MRITGGELRSRILRAPAGERTRPSADKLRQALFNIVGPALSGRWFVDVYAGSGAVGIEAWSRGARPVMWIEQEHAVARVLRANLMVLGIGGPEARVSERSARAGLEAAAALAAGAGGGGYVFLDPPYDDLRAYTQTLTTLGGWAVAGLRVIAEARRGAELPGESGGLRRERTVIHGDSQLVFYAAS